ncbi:MAG: aminotransferase class I/II-fold pyridoxal phosphate-dependent enzyme, partial [Bacteroidetes bacterium]
HRREVCYELLSKIEGMKVNYPQGAFYFFPDISDFFGKTDGETVIQNSDDFCEYLLHKAHVGTVAGTGFGAPNCFRLSYAASEEELREAIERIGNALARLK